MVFLVVHGLVVRTVAAFVDPSWELALPFLGGLASSSGASLLAGLLELGDLCLQGDDHLFLLRGSSPLVRLDELVRFLLGTAHDLGCGCFGGSVGLVVQILLVAHVRLEDLVRDVVDTQLEQLDLQVVTGLNSVSCQRVNDVFDLAIEFGDVVVALAHNPFHVVELGAKVGDVALHFRLDLKQADLHQGDSIRGTIDRALGFLEGDARGRGVVEGLLHAEQHLHGVLGMMCLCPKAVLGVGATLGKSDQATLGEQVALLSVVAVDDGRVGPSALGGAGVELVEEDLEVRGRELELGLESR